MSRTPSNKVFKGSFIDWMRRRYGISVRDLYKAIGWSRSRYFNHCDACVELARGDMERLAIALNLNVLTVFKDECQFYYGKASVQESPMA